MPREYKASRRTKAQQRELVDGFSVGVVDGKKDRLLDLQWHAMHEDALWLGYRSAMSSVRDYVSRLLKDRRRTNRRFMAFIEKQRKALLP